jgi:hypothetical protein
MRKTIVIEFIVDDDDNQAQKRQQVLDAISTSSSKLAEGLKSLGWSGNSGCAAVTVSNPKRTAHWRT